MINIEFTFNKQKNENVRLFNGFTDRILKINYFKDAKILPSTITNGIYDGGGLYFNDSIVPYSYLRQTKDKIENVPCRIRKEKVIFLDSFYFCYGHAITDGLRRFWFFLTKEFKKISNLKIVYLSDNNISLPNYFLKILEIFKVKKDQLEMIREPTQFDEVIAADPSFYEYNEEKLLFTKEYRQVIDEIKSYYSNFLKKNTVENDKIYFSRRKIGEKRGVQFGEKKLERFFRNQGYLIVYPELHTFDEQIAMLSTCHHFASTEGSCSHNSIFLPEDAEVIIIPRVPTLHTGYQQTLDSMMSKQRIFYIDSSLSVCVTKTSGATRGIYYYVSDELMDFFHITSRSKYSNCNFRDIRRYLNYNAVRFSHLNQSFYFDQETITRFFAAYQISVRRSFASFWQRVKFFVYRAKIKIIGR